MQHTSASPAVADDAAFEAPTPVNGKTSTTTAAAASTMFAPVSAKIAEAAKKGETSGSRTGKGKQVTYEFSKPPKNVYVKVHPNPDYHRYGLATYRNEVTGSMHFVTPDLFTSDELPERFKAACKIINCFTSAAADGTFFLWWVAVSSTVWYKAAMKTVEMARNGYGIVSTIRARNTYSFEAATEVIPEPKWSSIPPFEQLLQQAFDSIVSVADDKVVRDFMSGGISNRPDEDAE